jgi:paraquat-inducible protein B
MSKKPNPTLIGAFVVGATVLIAVGVALFGGAQFFVERNLYVAYFEEGTKGLRDGSNVLMNGVRIGHVSEIALLVDATSYETITRVTLEIFPDTFIQTRNGKVVGQGMQENLTHDQLIFDAGLRANLDIESYVTGQLLVELALRPDTRATLHGADPPHPEIPTVPSNIQELLDNVRNWVADARENIDFAELGERLESILRGVDELSNSEDLRSSLAGISAILNHGDTQALAGSMRSALKEVQIAAADASELFRGMDADVGTLTDELQPVISRLNEALQEAEQTLAAARRQLQGDSEQVLQLQATLLEIERATRAMREFFDYVERNPESLLKGRQE